MTLQDDLADLPDEALVPVSWIRTRLGASNDDDRISDLTVAEAAEELGRQPSTVRGWLGSGDLDGYKMNGREWRIPRDSLRAFVEQQRSAGNGGDGTGDADLGSWREEVTT